MPEFTMIVTTRSNVVISMSCGAFAGYVKKEWNGSVFEDVRLFSH